MRRSHNPAAVGYVAQRKGTEEPVRDRPHPAFDEARLRARGFKGFRRFQDLIDDLPAIPSDPGVYVVVAISSGRPTFLAKSVGGHFKGRDPTVAAEVLDAKWVDGAHTLSIGKANNLRRRLREYALYGRGRPIGHQGGRYIWQIPESGSLLVAWKATPNEDPRAVEIALLAEFRSAYGVAPFANLAS